jgi:hypothetical protein
MRAGPFDAWRAQEPPPDFADRAVRRFLLQRRRGGWTPRRWFVLGALAATTVAGAAWGYSAFTAQPPAARLAPAVEPPRPEPPPRTTWVPPPVPLPTAPPSPPPIVAPARPLHRPAAAPPAAAPDAGRKVMVPRCACDNDVLCSCL